MRKRGTVKWFDDEKGFGFISPADGTEDLFVHHRQIREAGANGRRSLDKGAKVEFDTERADKGPRATDVAVV